MIRMLITACFLLKIATASDNAQYVREFEEASKPSKYHANFDEEAQVSSDSIEDYFKTHAKRYEISLDLMQRYVDPKTLGSVLEVGACSMMNVGWIRRIQPDAYFHLIAGEITDSDPNVSVHNINIETEPFPIKDGSIQTALFFEVFEHMSVDPMAPLAEINRTLEMGGMLFLSTPNINSIWARYSAEGGYQPNLYHKWSTRKPRTDRHNLEYSTQLLAEVARNAGFEIVEHTTIDVYAHPHMNRDAVMEFKRKMQSVSLCMNENILGDTQFMVLRKVSDVANRHPQCLYE